MGVVGVRDVLEHRDQHEADGPGQVQGLLGGRADAVGLAQVGLEMVGGALGGADQQRPGVGVDDRVEVDVDDPGAGVGLLGDLVSVGGGRDAGADAGELADARRPGQFAPGPPEEGPVGPDGGDDPRVGRGRRPG